MKIARVLILALLALPACGGASPDQDPIEPYVGAWMLTGGSTTFVCQSWSGTSATSPGPILEATRGTTSDLVLGGCQIPFDVNGAAAYAHAGWTCTSTGALGTSTTTISNWQFVVEGDAAHDLMNGTFAYTDPMDGPQVCSTSAQNTYARH